MTERIIQFVDNSNIFQGLKLVRPDYRLDWKLLHQELERQCGSIWDTHFFVAQADERDSQRAFFHVLRTELKYSVHICPLKMRTFRCSECGVEKPLYYEKGVDVAMAVKMTQLAHDNAFDTALIVSGDGDFLWAIDELRRLGKHTQVVAFRDSVAHELKSATNESIIYLDDIAKQIEFIKPDGENSDENCL